MKTVLMLLVGVLLFAASAGVSWYLHRGTAPHESQKPETSAPAVAAAGGPADRAAQPVSPRADDLPVAARPREMSVEELVRYSMGLKTREESLRVREEELNRQRDRQKLALADLQAEQQGLTALLATIRTQHEAAQELWQRAAQEREQLAAERQAAEAEEQTRANSRVSIESDQRDNVKRLSDWIQAMDPVEAADVLREFANDGNLDLGVQILSNLEERDAAEILSSLRDPKLVGQFVESFRNMKRPPQTQRSR
jgi:flagellar motility protein MotE (MotC chaperone)